MIYESYAEWCRGNGVQLPGLLLSDERVPLKQAQLYQLFEAGRECGIAEEAKRRADPETVHSGELRKALKRIYDEVCMPPYTSTGRKAWIRSIAGTALDEENA